jgi:hypothetical protein
MQLLKLQDVQLTVQDRIFKESALLTFFAAVVFAGLAVAMSVWNRFGDLPFFFVVVSGGFLASFSLICFGCFAKTLAPTNWLLAVGPDRMMIKFRSYLNPQLPADDPQVILLPFSEVEAAQITKQKITCEAARSEGPTTEHHTYLDLLIRGQDLQPLRESLKYERTAKVTKDRIICKTSTKAVHYPVSVPDDRTIRIQWRCPSSHIVPGVRKVVDVLVRQRVNVRAMERQVKDYTKAGLAKGKESEAKILELAEKGKTIAATRLASKVYNYNTTEAKQFVEGLLQ